MMKKNIFYIFLILALLSISVFTFNKKVNVWVNMLKYKTDTYFISRDYLYTYIYLSRKHNYEYVYICGSPGTSALNPMYFNAYTGKKMFAINSQGISPLELYNLLKYYLKYHPETKNVVVSLELPSYLKCFDEYTILKKPPSRLNNFIRTYLSTDAVIQSYKSLFYQYDSSEYGYCYNNKAKFNYDKFCEYDNLKTLEDINSLVKKHNLNAIYYIPPVNALYLADMNLKKGKYKHIENLKRSIVKITPYYDMSFINEYTKRPVYLYFLDAVHINHFIPNTQIIDMINGKKADMNTIQYITKDNVNEILNIQKQLIYKYIEENKTYVENYINFTDNISEIKRQEKFVDIDKLPVEEQKLFGLYCKITNDRIDRYNKKHPKNPIKIKYVCY